MQRKIIFRIKGGVLEIMGVNCMFYVIYLVSYQSTKRVSASKQTQYSKTERKFDTSQAHTKMITFPHVFFLV